MIPKPHVLIIALLAGVAALPAQADSRFTIRRMTRDDVPVGKGQCDIRLQVDGEVEVSIRGNELTARTFSGRDIRDDGSECNEPLPDRMIEGFNYEVRERRGDIALLAEPSPRNGFRAVVRIRDSKGGEGRYHFRLSWADNGGGRPVMPSWGGGEPNRGGGFGRDTDGPRGGFGRDADGPRGGPAWNDNLDFRGEGRGVFTEGRTGTRVREAAVRVERGGRLEATLVTERGRIAFLGRVTRSDRDTLWADVTSGGIRGVMVLTLGRRNEVLRISMDGRSRGEDVRLNWSR
jgi:hypothetical protein